MVANVATMVKEITFEVQVDTAKELINEVLSTDLLQKRDKNVKILIHNVAKKIKPDQR